MHVAYFMFWFLGIQLSSSLCHLCQKKNTLKNSGSSKSLLFCMSSISVFLTMSHSIDALSSNNTDHKSKSTNFKALLKYDTEAQSFC